MRSLWLLLAIQLTTLSYLTAQESGGVEEAPEGTNWIANRRLGSYYPIDCWALRTVPRSDRLYYATESAVQADGYVRSPRCGPAPAGEPRLEDAGPRLQDAPPSAISARRRAAPSTAPVPIEPENKHRRQGFWFNGGFGYGSLGCDGCGGREGGLSGGLALGGSVSQKVLLGVGTNAWTKEEFGARLTVGTLVALIRFYPSATGGFFLLGGLGVGNIEASIDGFGSESETGAGALLGLGWDIRVGNNVSLTPFWNGFAARTDNADANVGQLGLSVTLH